MSLRTELRDLFVASPDELPRLGDIDHAIRRPLFGVLAAFGLLMMAIMAFLHVSRGRADLVTPLVLGVSLIAGCTAWALRRREFDRPLQVMQAVLFFMLGWATLHQSDGLPAAGWWLAVVPFILAGGGFFRMAIVGVVLFVAIVTALFFAPGVVLWLFAPEPPVEPWRRYVAIVGSEMLALAMILLAFYGRRRTAQALEAARAAATQAAAAQSRFLAKMSHEIRTPLNGIIGAAELLDSARLSDAQRMQLLGLQRQSSMTLLALVNDVLDLAKLDAGKVALEQRKVFVRGIVFEANELFSVQAFAKGIELSSSCSPNVPQTFIGDPTRLRQIINNLVGNAVKFTDKGGVHIHLCIDEHDLPAAADGRRRIRIEVSDSGPGIAPDKLGELFSTFAQADETITRRYGGTGLGLSIALELAHLMGGDIDVRSTLGEGSTFTLVLALQAQDDGRLPTPPTSAALRQDVLLATAHPGLERHLRSLLHELRVDPRAGATLPEAAQLDGCSLLLLDAPLLAQAPSAAAWLAAQAAAGRRVAVLTPVGADALVGAPRDTMLLYKPVRRRALETLLATRGPQQVEAGYAERAPRPAIKAHVLVVEDNPVNQVVIQAMIADTGASCVVATDGLEALDCLAAEPFDLVLMDMHMPGLDGPGATRELRAREGAVCGGRRTPVIAMTASTDPEERERCSASGMDGLLAKPFVLAQLRRCLDEWAPVATPRPATTARSTTAA